MHTPPQENSLDHGAPPTSFRRVLCESELIDGFRVSHVTLLLPGLAEELHGVRLLQLSDLHFGPATSLSHIERAVRIARPLNPDILLLTGDYLQLSTIGLHHLLTPSPKQSTRFAKLSHRRRVRELSVKLESILSQIKAPLGTFAVLGNHDYSEGVQLIRNRLGTAITWLTNRSNAISVGEACLHIAGVDDLRYGEPNVAKTLEYLEVAHAQKAGPWILLAHNPDILLDHRLCAVDELELVVCGHTHGGQICLPHIGPILTRTKQKKHVSGLSFQEGVPVYVSNGVGYGGFSFRLNCPPEIVVFELRARVEES